MNTRTFLLGGCVKHRGLPIANVELTLMRAANRFAGTPASEIEAVLTPGSGEYRFNVEAGEYFLYVKPDQGTRFVSFQTEPIFVNANTKLDVPLELGRVWSGKFTCRSQPAVEYSYELRLSAEQGGKSILERPIKLGENFELVLEKTAYKAAVLRHSNQNDGTEPALAIWTENLQALSDMKRDIVLPELFKLTGRILDEQGAPVSEAQVMVLSEEYLRRATTDVPPVESVLIAGPDGRFMGVLPEGNYLAMIEAANLAACAVTVKLHTDTEIDVSMSAGLIANGQVLWKGIPVTSLKLLITGVNREFLLPAQVDAQGRFDVCLPSGSYEFRIAGCEHTWMPPAAPPPPAELEAATGTGNGTAGTDSAGADTGAGNGTAWKHGTIACSDDGLLSIEDESECEAKPAVTQETQTQSATEQTKATESAQAENKSATTAQSAERIKKILAPWVRLIGVSHNIDGNIKLQDGYVVEFEVVDQDEHAVADCVVDCRLYEAERDVADSTHSAGPTQQASSQHDSVPSQSTASNNIAPYGIIGRTLTNTTGRCRFILGTGIYSFDFTPDKQSQVELKQIRQLSISNSLRRKVRLASTATAEVIAMESALTGKATAGVGVE